MKTTPEKDLKIRKANAEKQRRYRESMKAQGCRARLIWERPLESGWVRLEAPVIRESSIDFARKNSGFRDALEVLYGTFINDCKKKGIPKKEWEPVYKDIQSLLQPLNSDTDGY